MKTVIYESFSMRLHLKSDAADQEKTWTLVAGKNDLEHFWIGSVDNPMPEPKTAYEEIPGRNGDLDMSENSGRVLFNRKTVAVILQGESAFDWMDEIEDALRPYQGRVVDFAFDEPGRVEWFHTGRLNFESNRFRNRITLTFDTEPLMTNLRATVMTIPVTAHAEYNTTIWTVGTVLYGNLVSNGSYGRNISLVADKPGTVVELTASIPAGHTVILGIAEKTGGDVEFRNIDAENGTITYSKTHGVAGQDGLVRLRVTIDGSAYSWVTVGNNTLYYPICRINYAITDLGETPQTHDFPSNVLIEPEISVEGEAIYLIADGTAAYVDGNGVLKTLDGAVLPGYRSDFSAETVTSYIAAVQRTGASASPETTVILSWHEKRVG